MRDFTVVTVTYNSSHIIGDFIEKMGFENGSDTRLIIVDSGSDPEDARRTKAIADQYGAEFILSRENIGYGAGSNIGARLAKSDWLLFINPDVAISLDQCAALVTHAQDGGVDCLGPRVLDTNGRLKISWGRTITPPWRTRPSGISSHRNGLSITETISGCCMAIRRDVFDRLNGFDENFFLFCEEMDLHRRLNDVGGVVALTDKVEVITPGGASSTGVSERWRHVERAVGHTNYMRKHFFRLEGWIAVIYNILRIAVQPRFRPMLMSLRQYNKGIRRQN
ncbi:glycosyltransferase family 2 protein [Arthrobacter crystallopoietes]|uniref:Glycosyltransferase, GT2 family n=1 Tax=Crystallibacter crystallopoietes TaxID=37928 RepID=A0A1H0ZQZ3_9MICC|nr:glycosyltransferase [Arthrobacter crystallopoietes]AUI51859.1 hypothetical protein AC20117_14740 [Arthrobacter crystallopoietes]SDQ29817.1 Glycosyltransferase, GT2 family [Arthrobacter crystallopoietes]